MLLISEINEQAEGDTMMIRCEAGIAQPYDSNGPVDNALSY